MVRCSSRAQSSGRDKRKSSKVWSWRETYPMKTPTCASWYRAHGLQQEVPVNAVELRHEGRGPVLAHDGACLFQQPTAGLTLASAPLQLCQQPQPAIEDEPRPGGPARGEPLLHLGDAGLPAGLAPPEPSL